MAQRLKQTDLYSKTARAKLKPRANPYWRLIRPGLHLGYRRNLDNGAWVARVYLGQEKYFLKAIGTADSFPKGGTAKEYMLFDEAQERAIEIAETDDPDPEPAGPYTVNGALDAYFAHLKAEGSKSLLDAQRRANLLIRPPLGQVPVAELTRDAIARWRNDLASCPKYLRGKKGEPPHSSAAAMTEDAKRRRKATANRTLTILKAALNYAFREGKASSDTEWRTVKPFREVETARVRHFSIDECRRLVNAAQGPFRDLINSGLFTGARYGELCRLRVRDFHPDSGTLFVEKSKSGKARHVVLTGEGQVFFRQLTAGRAGDAIMLSKDGAIWGPSHQMRLMTEACRNANIRAAGFHILRHSYASLLVMAGAPLPVVAQNLGHADTRMVERHYSHLTPSYLAETIRKFAPAFGTIEQSNVVAVIR